MYIMRTKKKNGSDFEKKSIAEFEEATESRLVLYSIRDSIQRMNYACEVRIWTECTYVAAAINNHWVETWNNSNWKNSRGEEVKDSNLWSQILQELEENGHQVTAEVGKHELSGWMDWMIPITPALRGAFKDLVE